MAALRPPEVGEADYDSEPGLFFRRLGEIALGTNVEDAAGAFRLAVASREGVIIFCGKDGEQALCGEQRKEEANPQIHRVRAVVYVAKTASLFDSLEKWNSSDE